MDLATGVRYINCKVQREIEGVGSSDAFRVSKEGSLSHNTVNTRGADNGGQE